MQCRKLYLDAPTRTQDLLTMKWTLRGKGYGILSTWHEDPRAGLASFDTHWGLQRVAEMRQADTLVVLAGQPKDNLSLAALAGMAVGFGINVVWIGTLVDALREVRHFATPEEFYRQEVDRPFAVSPKTQAA